MDVYALRFLKICITMLYRIRIIRTSKILKVFVGALHLANFIHKNMNLHERDRSDVWKSLLVDWVSIGSWLAFYFIFSSF